MKYQLDEAYYTFDLFINDLWFTYNLTIFKNQSSLSYSQ